MWIDKQGEFNVASRTMNWVKNESNSFWKAAIDLGVEEKLKSYPTIALQGELVGEGLQGNRLNLKGQTVYFYNAYDFEKSRYLNFDEFITIVHSLGLETVPIISTNFKLFYLVDDMVTYAMRRSLLTPESWAEGVVVRPLVERQDEDLGRLSFKTINPEYLLKHGE
jgi:RNA ligase (TIGR02306 family)